MKARPRRRKPRDTAAIFVITAGSPPRRNGHVVAAMPPAPTLPRSGGSVTLRPDELTVREGYRVEVPLRWIRRPRSKVPNDPPSTSIRARNRRLEPRTRPGGQTVRLRRRPDYSALTPTRVNNPNEGIDGRSPGWAVFGGRTSDHISLVPVGQSASRLVGQAAAAPWRPPADHRATTGRPAQQQRIC